MISGTGRIGATAAVALVMTCTCLAQAPPPSEPGARPAPPAAATVGGASGPAPDEPRSARNGPGTNNYYKFIPAAAFQTRSSSTTPVTYWGAGYVAPAGGEYFWAPLDLPAGSLLRGIRLFYYDADGNNLFIQYLTRFEGEASPTSTDLYSQQVTGTAGFTSAYMETGAIGETIRDIAPGLDPPVSYVVQVYMAGSQATRFKGVRLFWAQQISPAPATATFADVPVGAFAFAHIEALAASGITAGCGGGNFCPNDPVTRAQMAVFLAKGLGLSWPN